MRTAAALALLALAAGAEPLASPVLSSVLPRGGQRGTDLEVVLGGQRLKDAQELFLYGKGLEVLKLEAIDDSSVRVCLRIAEDCPLGEQALRLRTATGITEARTFHVGPFPAIDEVEPNSEASQAQKIPLDMTVAGVLTNEDVDHYVVHARKGERVSAEIEGIRLGVTLLDPHLTVLGPKGDVIAVVDDTALLLQDCAVSFLAPEKGDYVIRLRDSSYAGSDNARYRLHVGTFPRPLAAYPPGGKAGDEVDVSLLGDPTGPLSRKIRLPADARGRVPYYPDQAPSPVHLRAFDGPNVLEKEPNDERAQATATDLPLPVALNGIIAAAGDEDWFRFRAKKGDAYDVRVHARSVRSPLDAVLEIHKAGGGQVASDDDRGGPDPAVRFSASEDGEYEVRVRDHLRRGGPTFVYRVEFAAPRPDVYAHIPAYEREPGGQTRQWVTVPRGNRFATWVRVSKTGASGDMNLSFEGLPAGVRADCETVVGATDRVPVVFEAAADAPVAGALAGVVVKPADSKDAALGGFQQDINLVFGPPNNTVFYSARASRLAVAVAEEAPFSIRIQEPKVPLVLGGSMNLKVIADRKAGFKGAINLRMLWNPPGMSSQNTVAIPEGRSEALYPVNASGNAALRTWKIAILGDADGGHGSVWVSTPLTPVALENPYLTMKFDMTSVPQGQTTNVRCAVEQLRAFEGKAKVTLLGFPPGVSCEKPEAEITKDDKEVVFKLAVEPKSPLGRHKTLFCQVLVPRDGETMAHNLGAGGVFRIDAPPKKDAGAGKTARQEAQK